MAVGKIKGSSPPIRHRERHAATREHILKTARGIVHKQGFRSLSMRSLATAAGSSIGGLYYYFPDFDDLVLHLNAETVRRLDRALQQAYASPTPSTPAVLVDAYFDFVLANGADWSALFEHHLPSDYELPIWYRQVIDLAVGHAVAAFGPALSHLDVRKRTDLVVGLWAALHGLTSLERDGKLATVEGGSSARAIGHLLVQSALCGVSGD